MNAKRRENDALQAFRNVGVLDPVHHDQATAVRLFCVLRRNRDLFDRVRSQPSAQITGIADGRADIELLLSVSVVVICDERVNVGSNPQRPKADIDVCFVEANVANASNGTADQCPTGEMGTNR